MENLINKIIHYEENIFYLKILVNNIKKSLIININTELFHLKIKEDLLFIDKTTKILFEHLLKNKKLLSKDEHLHSIMELKKIYVNQCIALIEKNFIKESDFIDSISNNNKDIETINELLFKLEQDLTREDLTTNEELNFLFMNGSSEKKDN